MRKKPYPPFSDTLTLDTPLQEYVEKGKEIALSTQHHSVYDKRVIISKFMKNFERKERNSFQDGYYDEYIKLGRLDKPVAIIGTHTCICLKKNIPFMSSLLEDNGFMILCVGKAMQIEEKVYMRIIARQRGFICGIQEIREGISKASYGLHEMEINEYKKHNETKFGTKFENQFMFEYKTYI